MRRLAYRIGRIVGAFLRRHLVRPAWVEELAVEVPKQPLTRAQRVARIGINVDSLYFAENGKAVLVDVTLWEAEMNAHLLKLGDGVGLWVWASGVDA